MEQRIIQTNRQLSAARQIDAAIAHFDAGDFECAITLSHAAEGAIPEPTSSKSLLRRLIERARQIPLPNGQKDEFNFAGNWLKHPSGPEEWEIEEMLVKMWLQRAVSKFYQVYGSGTPAMVELFPWAGKIHNLH